MKSYSYSDFTPKRIECSLNGRERTLHNCYLVANNALRTNGMHDKADELKTSIGNANSDEMAFKKIEEFVKFGDTGYIERDWIMIEAPKKKQREPVYKEGGAPNVYEIEPKDIESLRVVLKAENDRSNCDVFAKIHPRFREIANCAIREMEEKIEKESDADEKLSKEKKAEAFNRLYQAILAIRRSKMERWAMIHIICERTGGSMVWGRAPKDINAEERNGIYEQIYNEQEGLYNSTFNKKMEALI